MGVKFRFPFNWNSDYSDGKRVFLQFPEIKGNLGTYYQIFENFLQGISGLPGNCSTNPNFIFPHDQTHHGINKRSKKKENLCLQFF